MPTSGQIRYSMQNKNINILDNSFNERYLFLKDNIDLSPLKSTMIEMGFAFHHLQIVSLLRIVLPFIFWSWYVLHMSVLV